MKQWIKNIRSLLQEYAYEEHSTVTHPLILMYLVSVFTFICEFIIGILLAIVIIPISVAELSIMLFDWYDKKYKSGKRILKIIDDYYKTNHKKIKSYYLQNSINSINIVPFNTDGLSSADNFIEWFVKYGKDQYYTMCNGIPVCDLNRRRSAGDIWLITKHYFPTCTFEQVMKCLIKLSLDDMIPITCSYCTTIHKLVFFVGYRDVSLNSKTEYSSNITLKDLIKIYK